MNLYQHDSAATFRFVLRGELAADRVQELEHAWNTAKSILGKKEVVVEISGITKADPFGVGLLCRMRKSGARLTAALPPESAEFIRSMGLAATTLRRHGKSLTATLLQCFRIPQEMTATSSLHPNNAPPAASWITRIVRRRPGRKCWIT